jgi:hypothetical protein
MLPPFKNAKGSVIKRGGKIGKDTYPIGKVIGGKVYMHIDYIDTLPSPEQARIALRASGLARARCLSYDPKNEIYMFSEAPDFNKASEPAPRKSVKVEMDGDDVEKIFPAKDIKQIWHHRWEWVDDNYKGFDVNGAYERSKRWAAKISNPSGYKRVWDKQLIDAGLSDMIEEGFRFQILARQLLK